MDAETGGGNAVQPYGDDFVTHRVDQAKDLIVTQSRLRGLLRASRMVASDLSLPVVLTRIVEAACDLVDARYGALGVIARDQNLEQFIHVGFDESMVRRIGDLPRGKGILGLLIREPYPLRLDDITTDHRADGFPAGHPPMHSFLGVPIRIGTKVFGNLYLTDKQNASRFTAEDEELVQALAASAGVAIENARLFEEAQRRQRWLQASTDITRYLLAEGPNPLELIARRTQEIAVADFSAVLLPRGSAEELVVEVATGEYPDGLVGAVVSASDPLAGQNGPSMVIPLIASGESVGALVLGRRAEGRLFTDADIDMASGFAGHIALALELAQARADRDRIAVLEERDRIARDLHDHVIQRIFATAIGLQGLVSRTGEAQQGDRLTSYIDDLDETIGQIRTTIFQLRRRGRDNVPSLRGQILDIVDDATVSLGFAPHLRFEGALDSSVCNIVGEHLVAVLREALSNVARHASATQVYVTVWSTDGQVRLDVIDNGVGGVNPEGRDSSSGLANMRSRAEELGGRFIVFSPAAAGTRLSWSARTRALDTADTADTPDGPDGPHPADGPCRPSGTGRSSDTEPSSGAQPPAGG
ncbi:MULTISPECIES: sensor histidine kinase [Protofrankia]|uniref:Putative signal transduction histidine kinase n=1 Tax=Candidatus Protofrankia datiscae TaxID=2716812 RepID=F8B186_9ACTN|nr:MULTISPECIES: GAF domain-containing protein [Protofrankia]AEH08826.1 putative signal transduction histidine kinase [Candidatus Protofrankia datiscae]